MIMAPDVSYTLVSDLVTVYLLQFLSHKCNQDISLYCRNQKKESKQKSGNDNFARRAILSAKRLQRPRARRNGSFRRLYYAK